MVVNFYGWGWLLRVIKSWLVEIKMVKLIIDDWLKEIDFYLFD